MSLFVKPPMVRSALVAILLGPLAWPLAAAKAPEVPADHLRWDGHDVALVTSIAWQEERDGKWVTVVLVTDRPVPRDSVAPGASSDTVMTASRAQGIAFAVRTGGVPPPNAEFEVWYLADGELRSTKVTGAGGFDVESQSATAIKGRVIAHADGTNAFAAHFDAPVLRGDTRRMEAEGEALGATGGAPWKDLQIATGAARKKDVATLLAYASSQLAEFLKDEATRAKRLEMLKSMAPAEARVLGGFRKGASATVYWVAISPGTANSRCVDEMTLVDGKWRSTASACQAE